MLIMFIKKSLLNFDISGLINHSLNLCVIDI